MRRDCNRIAKAAAAVPLKRSFVVYDAAAAAESSKEGRKEGNYNVWLLLCISEGARRRKKRAGGSLDNP